MEARKGAVRNVQICRKDRGEASLARASAQAARPSPEGVIGSMSRSVGKWIVFVDDGVFIAVILGGRHDADLSVYFEEGDRDHQGDSARISCRFGLDGTPCDLTAIRIGVYQTGLARADRDRRLPTPIFGKRNDASRHGLENSLVIRAMDHGTWIPGWRSERIGRTTWRDIVGDTGEWKEAHEDQVLAMVRPDRLDRAKDYAVEHGCDIFEALDEVRRSEKRWKYRRRPPRRSALPPRRSGEERNTRRYVHPPLHDPAKGYLRHIPPGSKITGARRGLHTEAKLARFTA